MAATLDAIRTKVRKLTRSLSESQLSTIQLDDYINTFILYDFPEHLRLFNLKETFSFYTEPYIDTYDTVTAPPTSPLFNFKNKYLTIHPPIYIAGYQAWFCESRNQFFGVYPLTNSISNIGQSGDGINTNFQGVVNSQQSNLSGISGQQIVLLRNNVLFSSIDSNGNGLALIDLPTTATTGIMIVPNDPSIPYGAINYVTGAFNITFPSAPGAGQPIFSQTIPSSPALPQAMLFYDGKFTLRPVPDQPYKVTMDVFVRPTELLNNFDEPKLQEWWQYIAYGAARKVFQDRMDLESIALIEPEYKMQEMLIQRRTIVQQTSQRSSTIYTDQLSSAGAYGPGWFWSGGNF